MKKLCSALCLTILISANAQVNLTSSLVACYALNGNASEPVNNLSGTLTGVSAGMDRFNTSNSALTFTGSTTSLVELPSSPLLKPDAISVSAWYKATSFPQRMTALFAKNIYSSNHTAYGLAIEYVNGIIRFLAVRQAPSGSDMIVSTTIPALNTWYHVVFTIDNVNMQLFVNGTLEASMVNTISNFNYDLSKTVILGGTNELADNPVYFGLIDNLRFYNRIINGAEVAALYSQDPSCLAQPAPVTGFSLTSKPVCKGQAVSLADQSNNTPTAWSWTMTGASPATSTASNPVVIYATAGTYTITHTASNGSGAGAAVSKTISVAECTGIEHHNIFDDVLVYPNPAQNSIKIKTESSKLESAVLKTITGSVLAEVQTQNAYGLEMNTEQLEPGIYFLELHSGNESKVLKIIKE